VHQSYDNGDPSVNPIGTGPYLPETNEVGVRQTLVLVNDKPHLVGRRGLSGPDRIYRLRHRPGGGSCAAAQSGEIDAT
jgi:peptide/nickel transport system substrate-binding protein